ncbi:alpha/beta hydrolase family protein [Chitinophaga tropicalis]|uniref:Prolyl oligopeptidase family serine peptidase n=1 Tax=Chitinophaga tropicalis TaxID=2683588 RepID=A0A7K1U5M3_9BACT|nr:prolyl oligopeptidase family serine peptidase [Chitinophaga tropicalis]MVT09663.1 prolyl oligopeptidase family serine peptidase [Chitinophaga tropicalis]
MRFLIGFVFFSIALHLKVACQKLPLNQEALKYWSSLGKYEISDDGQVFYFIKVNSSQKPGSILTVHSSRSDKDFIFYDVKEVAFVNNCKSLFFTNESDSIFILDLESFDKRYIASGVSCFTKRESRYILFRSQEDANWIFRDLISNNQKIIPNVLKYSILDQGGRDRDLFFGVNVDGSLRYDILKPDFNTGNIIGIMRTQWLVEFSVIMNRSANVVLTKHKNPEGEEYSKIWLCSSMNNPTLIYSDSSVANGGKIEGEMYLNKDGNKVIFLTSFKKPSLPVKTNLRFDLWSYNDSFGKEEEERYYNNSLKKYFIFDAISNSITEICDKNRDITAREGFSKRFLFFDNPNIAWFKRKQHLGDVYLYDADLKKSVKILDSNIDVYNCAFISSDEKKVVYYDYEIHRWYSYDLEYGKKILIGRDIAVPFYDLESESIGRKGPFGICGWSANGQFVYIYDKYDIWKVGLNERVASVNITNGFGRANTVVFMIKNIGPNLIIDEDSVVLSAYHSKLKTGGYWAVNINKRNISFSSKQLNDYSVSTRFPPGIFWGASGDIVKAKNANIYLVVRENAETAPNLYLTKDLVSYQQISNIHPEKVISWFKAKLYSYKLSNGVESQGILYFPETLDTSKRWPIIFNYYEKRSDEFRKFYFPDFSFANINIPYAVAQGYLVFIPDIYSTPGKIGEGTLMSVNAAVEQMKELPFVDTTRMGLQGHSYGGWQTNFLIANSTQFAAACEFAGSADHVSSYGQLAYPYGHDRQEFIETNAQGSPYGLNHTPWSNSKEYLENSPIFKIGNITTPLLMFHNKTDVQVPFSQGVELFLGMRRAGKRVWLFQYDDFGHQFGGEGAKDFHMRMFQFFDHFLKNTPAPKWMVRGIPAYLKGVDDGY